MAKRYLKTTITAKDLASPTFKRVQKAVAGLGAIAAAVGVYQVGRQLVNGLERAVEASAKYESAAVRLSVALANQGENTKGNRDKFREYAAELSKVSLATETQILGAVAQAKSFGASNEAAKKLTATATDLASATGVDMETAFRQINRTLGGFAGELGELFPELKKLTAEQLQAGEAADVLSRKIGGAGAAGAKTYEGALNNLNSSLDRLFVTIGGPIREVLNLYVQELTGLVDDTQDAASASDDFRYSVITTGIGAAEAAIGVIELAQAVQEYERALGNAATKFGANVVETLLGADPGSLQLAASDALDPIAEGVEARLRALVVNLRGLLDLTPDSGADTGNFERIVSTAEASFTKIAELKREAFRPEFEPWEDFFIELNASAFEFTENIGTQWAGFIQNSLDGIGQLGATLITEGGDVAKQLGQLAKGVLKQAIALLIQYKIQSLLVKSTEAASTAAVNSIAMAGALGQVYANTFASIAAIPIIGPALAPGVAAANLGLATAGAAGAQAVGAGLGLSGFAKGGIIPGVDVGRDSVLFAGRPGEAVLPKELTDYLLEAAGQNAGGSPVIIEVRADLPVLVDQLNSGVRSGAVRVVASDLAGSRAVR